MTIPLPILALLLLFALAGVVVALAYHYAADIEPVDDGRGFGGDDQ